MVRIYWLSASHVGPFTVKLTVLEESSGLLSSPVRLCYMVAVRGSKWSFSLMLLCV